MKEELKELAARVNGQFKLAPLPIVCYDLQMEKDYITLYEYVAKACPANILALIESHDDIKSTLKRVRQWFDDDTGEGECLEDLIDALDEAIEKTEAL